MCTPPSSPARRHTLFRPCIDIHDGKVKQIVGGTLNTAAPDALRTNFVASHPPAHYAGLYRDNELAGGHVIMLGRGEGNVEAAREAVGAWRGECFELRVRRWDGTGLTVSSISRCVCEGAQAACRWAVGSRMRTAWSG